MEWENSDRELKPRNIYQNVLNRNINIREAFRSLINLSLYHLNQEIKAQAIKIRIDLAKSNLVWEFARSNNNIELYLNNGVYPSDAPVLALLEILIDCEILGYETNNEGYITFLPLFGSDNSCVGVFPEQICDLKFLYVLYFSQQNIRSIPKCVKNLTYLKKLDLSYNNLEKVPNEIQELKNLTFLDLSFNKIQELPTFVKELTHLNQLYLADEELNVPHRNVFDCLNVADLEENLSLKALSELFAKLEKKEQTERKELTKKFSEQKELSAIIYPPREILNTLLNKPRNFEYVMLWMLGNNFACGWRDFKSDPVNISQATLSKYLSILIANNYAYRVSKGYYIITESGRRRLNKIESSIKK